MCNIPFSNPFWAKTTALPAFQNNDSWCALCQLSLLLLWKCGPNSFQNLLGYPLLSLKSDTAGTESNSRSRSTPPQWPLPGRQGWASRTPVLWLLRPTSQCHFVKLEFHVISSEQRVLKLRSLNVPGPTRAPFPADEEPKPRLLTHGQITFPSSGEGSQGVPVRRQSMSAVPEFLLPYMSTQLLPYGLVLGIKLMLEMARQHRGRGLNVCVLLQIYILKP